MFSSSFPDFAVATKPRAAQWNKNCDLPQAFFNPDTKNCKI